MSEKNMTAAKAFGAFAKKLSRSFQAEDGSKPNIVYEDDVLQDKVNAKDQDYRLLIVSTYKKYLNPFHTFGKNSRQAESISTDEENLLKAYNLFKAVREANLTIGDSETKVLFDHVESPLCSNYSYTEGGEFIYLQCWLMFEQGIQDFIPELVPATVDFKTVYYLQFSPLRSYKFDYRDKETIAVIKEAFGK